MRLTLLLILGLMPYLTACNKTTEADSKPVSSSVSEDTIQQINKSLATIKETKEKIIAKQAEFASKKTEFESMIAQLKEELLQKNDADEINNRLKNISEYDAYLQEIERRLIIMKPVPDKLLSYERSFEAKLKMVSLMSEAELTELKNQLAQIQSDLGNSLEELVIDESQIQRKSIEDIRKEIAKSPIQAKEQSLNKQIEEEFCNGVFTRSNQLTTLTDNIVPCIQINYYRLGREIYFNGITSLSNKETDILLKIIDIVRRELRYDINLHLDGLKNISRYTTLGFKRNSDEEFSYYLTGLEDVSVDEGIYLVEIPKLVVSNEIRAKLNSFKQTVQ